MFLRPESVYCEVLERRFSITSQILVFLLYKWLKSYLLLAKIWFLSANANLLIKFRGFVFLNGGCWDFCAVFTDFGMLCVQVHI